MKKTLIWIFLVLNFVGCTQVMIKENDKNSRINVNGNSGNIKVKTNKNNSNLKVNL